MEKESWARVYEGEWLFVCRNRCGGYVIDFSFNEMHDPVNNFEDFYDISFDGYAPTRCACGDILKWYGCMPRLTTSKALSTLLDGKHFMVATVMVAAVIESYVSNLLYATLVDEGISVAKADKVASSRLGRRDAINLIKDLTGWSVRDISFPVRNMVAHGQQLTEDEIYFANELRKQVQDINKWFDHLSKVNGYQIQFFSPSEKDRWLLSMQYWIVWLKKKVDEAVI
jgi:hypothetical protein